jgi:hypothetical protein
MPIIASRASAAHGAGFSRVTAPPYAGPFGAYDSLSTVTLSANTASVVFAGIPTGYKHLQIRANFAQTGGGIIKLHLNGDTGANYKGHEIGGEGATAYAGVPSSYPNAICVGYSSGTTFGAAIIDILDYSSTTKNKVTRTLQGTDRNGAGDLNFDSGLWINTSAITSLTFSSQNANLSSLSSLALYGVK